MNLVRILYALLAVITEVNKIIKVERERGDTRLLKEKIDDDNKRISNAFATKNAEELNATFRQ